MWDMVPPVPRRDPHDPVLRRGDACRDLAVRRGWRAETGIVVRVWWRFARVRWTDESVSWVRAATLRRIFL